MKYELCIFIVMFLMALICCIVFILYTQLYAEMLLMIIGVAISFFVFVYLFFTSNIIVIITLYNFALALYILCNYNNEIAYYCSRTEICLSIIVIIMRVFL